MKKLLLTCLLFVTSAHAEDDYEDRQNEEYYHRQRIGQNFDEQNKLIKEQNKLIEETNQIARSAEHRESMRDLEKQIDSYKYKSIYDR